MQQDLALRVYTPFLRFVNKLFFFLERKKLGADVALCHSHPWHLHSPRIINETSDTVLGSHTDQSIGVLEGEPWWKMEFERFPLLPLLFMKVWASVHRLDVSVSSVHLLLNSDFDTFIVCLHSQRSSLNEMVCEFPWHFMIFPAAFFFFC